MNLLFITSYDASNACFRLQTDAIARGAAALPGLRCTFVKPDAPVAPGMDADVVGFHYNDVAAVATVRAARSRFGKARCVCFGSDIYAYSRYLELLDITDLFVVPTPHHRRVLAAQISTPIYVLVEPVDPLAVPADRPWHFPRKTGRRLGWFGYPESFYKGMYSLLPVINAAVRAGEVDDFVMITDESRFPNDLRIKTQAFAHERFAADVGGLDYVITSHFPLDLQVNSMIKSANKALAALAAGAITLVSDTPAYRDLYEELGLTRFIIESPRALGRFLAALDPVADSHRVRESGALELLRCRYNDERVAADFLALLADHERLPLAERVPLEFEARDSVDDFLQQRLQWKSRVRRAWQRLRA